MGARLVDEETIKRWIAEAIASSPGGGGVESVTVTLTDAQIKALPTTEVEVLAAPGVGKISFPLFVVAILDASSAAYSNIGGSSNCYFLINGSEFYLTNMDEVSQSFLQTQDRNVVTFSPNSIISASEMFAGFFKTVSGLENMPMTISWSNGGAGNFTGGNAANTLKVTVYYVVVDL